MLQVSVSEQVCFTVFEAEIKSHYPRTKNIDFCKAQLYTSGTSDASYGLWLKKFISTFGVELQRWLLAINPQFQSYTPALQKAVSNVELFF